MTRLCVFCFDFIEGKRVNNSKYLKQASFSPTHTQTLLRTRLARQKHDRKNRRPNRRRRGTPPNSSLPSYIYRTASKNNFNLKFLFAGRSNLFEKNFAWITSYTIRALVKYF